MRPEQIQPGALVYHLVTGRLYRLTENIHNHWWQKTEIGRRGELTSSLAISEESLCREHFALWCERCDGTGRFEGFSRIPCPDCDGEGLIR